MPKGKPGEKFEDTVEGSLKDLLKMEMSKEERIKAVAVAVRWVAVKNKLVLPDQGLGFEDEVK